MGQVKVTTKPSAVPFGGLENTGTCARHVVDFLRKIFFSPMAQVANARDGRDSRRAQAI